MRPTTVSSGAQTHSLQFVVTKLQISTPTIRRTTAFQTWIDGLRDVGAVARIVKRIDRLAIGNPGDVKRVGEGVSEMRIVTGPGYRVYFTVRGEQIVILLCSGDKSSQDRDIRTARALAKDL